MKRKKLFVVSAVSLVLISTAAVAEITFRNAITGEPLDMSVAKSGGNQAVFKQFKETGICINFFWGWAAPIRLMKRKVRTR